MMAIVRFISIAGLLFGASAGTLAAAQGRGDHDTPATQDPSESGGWQYRAPACRTTADGWLMCRDSNGYWYRDHYDPNYGGGWGNGYGGGYGYGVLPPRTIVRSLHADGFSHISEPVLSGRFYQVRALDPYGRNVKLYVDAYDGRIVKVK
jgi:hypothetical protein